jgi:molecular chaperone GrpE (heat shock protein)
MYIKQNLEELFTELGLTMIPTVGSAFDDTLHEAVKEEESDQASGTILQQVSVGFKKGDDVIIPAKVVVAK